MTRVIDIQLTPVLSFLSTEHLYSTFPPMKVACIALLLPTSLLQQAYLAKSA